MEDTKQPGPVELVAWVGLHTRGAAGYGVLALADAHEVA